MDITTLALLGGGLAVGLAGIGQLLGGDDELIETE